MCSATVEDRGRTATCRVLCFLLNASKRNHLSSRKFFPEGLNISMRHFLEFYPDSKIKQYDGLSGFFQRFWTIYILLGSR